MTKEFDKDKHGLHTVNPELSDKMSEARRANSDLQNLMGSTQIATIFLDRDLCLKRYTPHAADLFHIVPSDLGLPFANISHQLDHDDLPGMARRVLHRLETVEEELGAKGDGWFHMRMLPYRSLEGKIEGVVVTLADITESKQYQQAIITRERQQAAVADLGQWALTVPDLQDLMQRAVHQVMVTLDVPLCKVLELQPSGNELLLRAGVGWKEGYAGRAMVGTDIDSQAGYTLNTSAPVIVENLAEETRFSGPNLLIEHNVVSGISVIIPGKTKPYGVLGAHTTEYRQFSTEDAHFLQTVANVLAAAIERQAAENALRDSNALLEAVLQHIPAGVIVAAAPSGRLILGNERVDEIWRHPFLTAESVQEYSVYRGFHADGTPYQPEEWPLARAITSGEVVHREEINFERGDGTTGTMIVGAAPVYDDDECIRAGVVIFSDITERKKSESELQHLTETLEQRVYKRTAQIRALASALTLAEQRERHRVAAILHNDLQQLLLAAQFQFRMLRDTLESNEGKLSADVLDRMDDVLGRSVTVTRTLSIDLSPPILRSEGLIEAVKWLSAQMEELHGLRVKIDAETPILPASEAMRVLLFQLVRELLFNVVKHAGVNEAFVGLGQTDEDITIWVEDRGQGFDLASLESRPSGSQGGIGLFHMRERLHLFSGELHIETRKGHGTCATITVPANAAASDLTDEETW